MRRFLSNYFDLLFILLERDLGRGGAVRPSVCLSVCLSQARTMFTRFSLPGSPGTLAFLMPTLYPRSQGTPLTTESNETAVGK